MYIVITFLIGHLYLYMIYLAATFRVISPFMNEQLRFKGTSVLSEKTQLAAFTSDLNTSLV